MGVNSLPETVTRQRRDCDSNPCSSEPESGTLTTRLPSHLSEVTFCYNICPHVYLGGLFGSFSAEDLSVTQPHLRHALISRCGVECDDAVAVSEYDDATEAGL